SLRCPRNTQLERRGAAIALCTSGTVTLTSLGTSITLERGQSAFIAANEPMVTADGHGDLFVATTGLEPAPSLGCEKDSRAAVSQRLRRGGARCPARRCEAWLVGAPAALSVPVTCRWHLLTLRSGRVRIQKLSSGIRTRPLLGRPGGDRGRRQLSGGDLDGGHAVGDGDLGAGLVPDLIDGDSGGQLDEGERVAADVGHGDISDDARDHALAGQRQVAGGQQLV